MGAHQQGQEDDPDLCRRDGEFGRCWEHRQVKMRAVCGSACDSSSARETAPHRPPFPEFLMGPMVHEAAGAANNEAHRTAVVEIVA